jgi:hypothetical protein
VQEIRTLAGSKALERSCSLGASLREGSTARTDDVLVFVRRGLERMCRAGGQPQEGSGFREGARLCGWISTLEGKNPKGGTGMKQGRQASGGARP